MLSTRSSCSIHSTGRISATGESILQVLIRLNRKLGQTLVMVTHDPKIAAHADRIVELVNGRVREKSQAPAPSGGNQG